MSEGQLGGKTAVVTGGSKGIGFAIAASLVTEGVDVMICGRSGESLAKAIERFDQVPSAGDGSGRLKSFVADIRDPSAVAGLMAHAAEVFGRLDILINNAGVGGFAPLPEQPVDEWRAIVDTNLTGVFLSCHAAIPYLRRDGGGWIINISSLAGTHPFVGGSAYCASKAGLNALSEVLMQEVRYDDIRVSCVAPGSVDTGFAGGVEESATSWKLAPDDVARVVIDLLRHEPRSLPSRVEIRPSRPKK